MLRVTNQLEKKEFPPGASIIQKGESVEHFFMMISGEVDIILTNPRCPEVNVARLGPGQFFGEVELLNGGNSIASVRSAPFGSVELALLSKDKFNLLMKESPPTQETLSMVAQTRLEENRARNEDC